MDETKPPQADGSSQTTPPQAWDDDPENPLNWPTSLKLRVMILASLSAFTAHVPLHPRVPLPLLTSFP